ncbi:MAG: hypothetical protein RR374_00645 [Clostridia bacterium]
MKTEASQICNNTQNFNENKIGCVLQCDKDGLIIACKNGAIRVLELQLEGKKPMNIASFALGNNIAKGTNLNE